MDAYNPAGIFLKKSEYKVAAYCRISREDGDGESNSISTQKNYCRILYRVIVT